MRVGSFYCLLASLLSTIPTCATQKQETAQDVKNQQQATDASGAVLPHGWATTFTLRDQRARDAVARAEKLASERRWVEARKEISDLEGLCGGVFLTRTRSNCRAMIVSAAGYIDLKQSESLPAQSAEAQQLLSDAAKAFGEAVGTNPSNGPVLANLATVYRRLGKLEDARSSLEKAIIADPGRTPTYASQLGELELQNGHWSAAIQAFSRAVQAAPDSYQPRTRLVQIYLGHYQDLSTAERHRLIGLLKDSESAAPELARAGYEFLFLQDNGDGGDGEQALLCWVRLLARDGELNEKTVREFRDFQTNARLNSLATFLDRPWGRPDSASWWLGRPERRTTLADVSLSWGRTHQGLLAPELIEQCWKTGVDILPPGAEHGELTQIPEALQVALDLRAELVMLFNKEPALDPGRQKARALVGELFAEKSLMIARGDLESQQRYHTTLGQIFAAQGTWRSGDAANALYQLSEAIKVAQRRYREGVTQGFYQPLPELHALLAQGYHQYSTGDDAAHSALNAATAYFDSDDLAKAELWTTRAQEYHAPAKAIGLLRELLALRRAAAGPENSRVPASLQISQAKEPWLYEKNEFIPEDFLKRQRFKLLADISQRVPEDADTRWSAASPVEAFSLVIQGEGLPLLGAADLRRWQKVKAILFNILGSGTSPTQSRVQDHTPGSRQTHEPLKDHSVYVSLPGELQPERIAVTPPDVAVANITRTFGAEKFLLYYGFLKLDAGELFVSPDAPLAGMSPLLDQLRVEGLQVELTTEGVARNFQPMNGRSPVVECL